LRQHLVICHVRFLLLDYQTPDQGNLVWAIAFDSISVLDWRISFENKPMAVDRFTGPCEAAERRTRQPKRQRAGSPVFDFRISVCISEDCPPRAAALKAAILTPGNLSKDLERTRGRRVLLAASPLEEVRNHADVKRCVLA